MLATTPPRSAHGFGLPRHVEASFRRYLDCGIIERGFARVVCPSCHHEVLVPFSCKTRGLCPSCDGRRMADGAAHLVDRVLPACAAVRQWTLSFPRWLRIRLLRDPSLVSRVLRVFVHAVFGYHRRRARQRGVSDGHSGAVTAVQRAGSFAMPTSTSTRSCPEPPPRGWRWHDLAQLRERVDGLSSSHSRPSREPFSITDA